MMRARARAPEPSRRASRRPARCRCRGSLPATCGAWGMECPSASGTQRRNGCTWRTIEVGGERVGGIAA
eukprot:6212378-Pleurochrysis_carterae.AAC.1